MAKFKFDGKAIGYGALAGAGEGYGANFLGPNFGPAAVDIAIGAWAGNETLQTLGGMRLGRLALSQGMGQGSVGVP